MRWEDPRPFSAEGLGKSPPKARRGWTPRNQTNGVRYGWDDEDRLRVAQRFSEWGDEFILQSQDVLTFSFSASGDHLYIYCDRRPDGTAPAELRTITRRVTDEEGRLTGVVTWPEIDDPQSSMWVREQFDFDEHGRVCGITVHRDWGQDHARVRHGAPQRQIVRFEAVRDDRGALVRLEHQEFSEAGEAESERMLLWQRTSADELRAAEETIDTQLPQAVADWVARVRPGAAAYCVAILYGDTWSPSLGIGTVDGLEAWGPPGSADRVDRMWNPAEFACFDPLPPELNTPDLAESYRVTAQQWASATPDKIRAKCLALAAELKSRQLDLLPADQCVVYATDLELMDLEANFRKLGLTRVRRAIEKRYMPSET